MALVAGAANRVLGADMTQSLNLPSHCGLLRHRVDHHVRLRGGRRAGAVVPRPARRRDQPLSRAAADRIGLHRLAVGGVPRGDVAAAWLPQIILFLGLSMGDPAPVTYLQQHWIDVPRFLRRVRDGGVHHDACAADRVVHDAARLCVRVPRRAVRDLHAVHHRARAGDRPAWGQWISMFNLTNIPVHVND